MSDQSIKTCNVCHVSKPGNAFDSYNAHYAHKTCRDCEMPANKKRKPNQDAVKPPSSEMSPTKSATSLESAAAAMIRHAATIANAECITPTIGTNTSQKKCRDCGIMKSLTEFYIRDDRNYSEPSCIICRREYMRKRRSETYVPAVQNVCTDCKIPKSTDEYYHIGKAFDPKCKHCRLDYNARSRAKRRQIHKSPTMYHDVDTIIARVCQEVKDVELHVNAIVTTSPRIDEVTTSPRIDEVTTSPKIKKEIIAVDDETGDEVVAAPIPQHSQDEKQNVTTIRLNHPDRNADEVCNFTSGAGATPAGAQESHGPRGLEKFDQIELIGVIAKVFHLEIIELKCVYPAEDVRELSLWKSQVRELYATQNPGADEAYRRIMFDYGRAARELKNEVALRNISAA